MRSLQHRKNVGRPPIEAEGAPPREAPWLNAFAERWVGTVRRDCLDWLLIVSRRQLQRVLHVYVEHYNTPRPHRALKLTPPMPGPRLLASRPTHQLRSSDATGSVG